MADYKGPLPQKTPETAPFFDGLNEHKLMIQRCKACGPYFYPRPFCPSCFSWDVEWFEASGKGKLYSFDQKAFKCVDFMSGKELWKRRGKHGTLILADGHLIALTG